MKATKVTPEFLEEQVYGEKYWEVEDTTTTVCVIILHNGFTLVGHSACVNPADYDAALGRKYARIRAMEKLWALEGYHRKAEEHTSKAKEDTEYD